MKEFDYAKAWRDLAAPAVAALSPAMLDLYAATVAADEAEPIRQDSACDCIWPAGDLRDRFRAADPDELATAARAIYFFGHWHPGKVDGAEPLIGRKAGATWKFSHLADQTLREHYRVGRSVNRGAGLMIFEGQARIGYASPYTWTWQDIAPATVAGMAHAHEQLSLLGQTIAAQRDKFEQNSAAADFIEHVAKLDIWDTEPYMVEKAEQIRSEQIIGRHKGETVAEYLANAEKKIASHARKVRAEAARIAWFIEHNLNTENVIYYDHTDTVCIGWYTPLTDAAISTWLDIMTEYPWKYEIKGYQAYRDRQNAATTGAK